MSTTTFELDLLIATFREEPQAANGHAVLAELITDGRRKKLQHLLRDHHIEEIDSTKEINLRDDVDHLLDFYGVLTVAILSGRIAQQLPPALANEVKTILGNQDVITYYSRYYPLALPEILWKATRSEQPGLEESQIDRSPEANELFSQFAALVLTLRDQDIREFLWFIDDGYEGGYGLPDLMKVLAGKRDMSEQERSKRKNPLNRALWGFSKYTDFLISYKALIQQAASKPLLQSALWHHQAYWFNHPDNKFINLIQKAIGELAELAGSKTFEELKENKQSTIEEEIDFSQLKPEVDTITTTAMQIRELANPSFAHPIKHLLTTMK
jgi:hypothetical protein